MTLADYLKSLKGKKVTVLGIGVSNKPLLKLLASSEAEICACDKKDRASLGETADELESLGIKLSLGEGYLDNINADVIFRTPGMRPDIPAISKAVENGAELTSEMEIFFKVCPCPIIAVTGSDGKTTTSTLISEILKRAGYTCHLGGNIGHPLLADTDIIKSDDRVVVELSSFQLMTMRDSASTAVVTNVAPNHLDIHRDMAEYVEAKRNVFAYQSSGDRVVLNAENEITVGFANEAKGNVVFFAKHPIEEGVFLENDTIWARFGGKTEKVMDRGDIRLPGLHNVENYMTAIAALWGRVPVEAIIATAKEFGGVEHRIEFVRELKGVKFYNDSIATSPTRSIAGLHSFDKPLILIAGGYDKHLDYAPLAPDIIAHVKTLVLCGATAPKIKAAVLADPGYDPEKLNIIEKTVFTEAIDAAYGAAEEGDTVILSPASAGFDMFPNFAVRGRVFKEYVNSLK